MKKITFTIPEGHIPLDVREISDGDTYYIEVDLLEKKDMCHIKQPHPGFDCPCNKAEIDRK